MQRNLVELVLNASRAFGDDVAFQARRGFRVDRLSFRQVEERARQVAGFLISIGLVPRDRIAVWAPNMPEYALLFFGAWLAGMVVVPVDIRTWQEVMERFIGVAKPRLGFRGGTSRADSDSPYSRRSRSKTCSILCQKRYLYRICRRSHPTA
jgi:long-chain acyl-CoA synthetase